MSPVTKKRSIEQPTQALWNDPWLAKSVHHSLHFLKPEYGAEESGRSELNWITKCWKVIMEFLPDDTKNELPTPALTVHSHIYNITARLLSKCFIAPFPRLNVLIWNIFVYKLLHIYISHSWYNWIWNASLFSSGPKRLCSTAKSTVQENNPEWVCFCFFVFLNTWMPIKTDTNRFVYHSYFIIISFSLKMEVVHPV